MRTWTWKVALTVGCVANVALNLYAVRNWGVSAHGERLEHQRADSEKLRADACEQMLDVVVTGSAPKADRFVYTNSHGEGWLVEVHEACDAGTCTPLVRVTGAVR